MNDLPEDIVLLIEGLADEDRAHVRKILRGSVTNVGRGKMLSEVGVFLRDRTYFRKDTVEPFKKLDPVTREQILSELIWRVTCVLDGSVTEVMGQRWFPIGPGIRALRTEQAGKYVMCLALDDDFVD